MTSLDTLRREMPALALTIGFAPRGEREELAALLLLWLELRRAGLAGETMLAATRMAWWRDALAEGRGGVPLADSLIKININKELGEDIGRLVEQTLSTGRAASPHATIAKHLVHFGGGGRVCDSKPASRNNIAESEIADMLARLDIALRHSDDAAAPATAPDSAPSPLNYAPFTLILWCCENPSRLSYPHRHPLLALQMLLRAALNPMKAKRKA